ncbi:MAG: ppiA [Bacteroidetes bacterium]|nr:ppiA [Bacteroidota bacterium]
MKHFFKIFFISLSILLSVNLSGTNARRSYFVVIKTTMGDITVKLNNETPIHRDNFVKLVKQRYFDGILFHRVIDNFMIQSGDPDSKQRVPEKLYGDGGPGYDLPAEIVPGIFHKKGVLAAARESDDVNPLRKSSASQFYIVKGKVFDDEGLNTQEERVNKRNKALGIEAEYKISKERREVYKTIGGTPHLDTQYTIFGEVVKGIEIVDIIASVKTDKNDRPVQDVWIISTKLYKRRK